MKILTVFVLSLLVIFSSPVQSQEKIRIDEDIQLIHLQDSVFVHISYHASANFGRFPSNGLIIIKNGQALMIDTPMDNDKTERLTSFLRDSMDAKLTKLIIGHFHNDCMGGLEYLQSIGVGSVANIMTVEKCKETGLPVPSIPFKDSLNFDFNGERIECRFFGGGHSFDNITVWLPQKKILFGGCLVKSADAGKLGNLSDAVVTDWDTTINKIIAEYPEMRIVIPGHGDVGGKELLEHTIKVVRSERPGNLSLSYSKRQQRCPAGTANKATLI